jgi:hypothetical protein
MDSLVIPKQRKVPLEWRVGVSAEAVKRCGYSDRVAEEKFSVFCRSST